MKKWLVFFSCVVALAIALIFFRKKIYDHFLRKNIKGYTSKEAYITMRDGVRLYTLIYQQDDGAKHPILLVRTPYSAGYYLLSNLNNYVKRKYIIVVQDVRGKFMSEGEYEDIRPYKPEKGKQDIDEATDTYDSIDWLVKNVKDNNNKVGMIGVSYPGFYAVLGGLSQHPSLKAISPQAPVCDWFIGDDIHHNGAFMLVDAVNLFNSFGKQRTGLTKDYSPGLTHPAADNYKYYMQVGALKNLALLIGDSIKFWKDVYNHPNYDEWWKERDVSGYIQHMSPNVACLFVGGMFDAEDCFGTLKLYKTTGAKTPCINKLVMGPWSHGAWANAAYDHLGNIRFGQKTVGWYQKNIEIPFFSYYLEGVGDINTIKGASVFFTGANEWKTFDRWPPKNGVDFSLYLHGDGTLSSAMPIGSNSNDFIEYTSDPRKPVPYCEDLNFTPTKNYMVDDQRFASRRPDVVSYKTDTLTQDITLAGPVIADLFASISTTDADFVVKLIDVFPYDFVYQDSIFGKGNENNYPMGGYQMLVRGEVMRGRYRNSLEKPEAFIPQKISEIKYELPDVAHVFKKGHSIMVQVQSSWFPLVDRNPQNFIDIYHCNDQDFVASQIKIYSNNNHASKIILPVLK